MNESFIVYKSFVDALEGQPEHEVQFPFLKALCEYGIYGTEPKLTGVAKSLFTMAKPQIDANIKRKQNGMKGAEHGIRGAGYGKLGGRPKNPPMDEQKNPPMGGYENPTNVNVNVKVKENVNVKDNVKVKDNPKVKENPKEKFYPNDEELDEAFRGYVEFRKEIKKPMTNRAVDLAIKNLNDLSGGDNSKAIQILNQSVVNGWQGLFPLKNTDSREGRQTPPKEPTFLDLARGATEDSKTVSFMDLVKEGEA